VTAPAALNLPALHLQVVRESKRLKLDMGAGAYPRAEDFVTVDQFYPDADIKALMWDVPLPDGSVDEIWSSHALEHVAMGQVSATLLEWFRLLAPGARCIVQVPNFDYAARYWLNGPDRAWAEHLIFGLQSHEGEFHKSAFTAGSLKADLEGAGFHVERVEYKLTHNQETLQACARKPEGTSA